MKVEESLNVTFDESPSPTKLSPLVDDDIGEKEAIRKDTKIVYTNNKEDESIEVDKIINIKESKNHPLDQVIGNLNQRTLRSQAQNHSNLFCFISTIEPKNINEALKDESWVVAMQEKLNQFVANDVWELVLLHYIKEMLKKFGLEDSKPTKTPMSTEIKLTKVDEADSVDNSKYRGMIGSLLYLTASRPDIMFSVRLCARFLENPKNTHLEAIKRIFRRYVDRKSTSGVCTFKGCCLTSWFAKKKTDLAICTTEAEYVSAGKACQQALWMKQALIDYGIRRNDVPIICDNKGAIDLSKNPVQHSRTKHIEMRHHFLSDNVQKGNISIEKVASEDNIADIFTKPLKREVFNYLRLGLGMMELIMDSDP
ncbi:hypothetical protein Tco_0939163 [Tanacetum coccineum]|uniref:Copia protein n=1 Tax=Tanacetum coccineum TaxID=301880 RepID=A0ABQ5DLY5_9ASTR